MLNIQKLRSAYIAYIKDKFCWIPDEKISELAKSQNIFPVTTVIDGNFCYGATIAFTVEYAVVMEISDDNIRVYMSERDIDKVLSKVGYNEFDDSKILSQSEIESIVDDYSRTRNFQRGYLL